MIYVVYFCFLWCLIDGVGHRYDAIREWEKAGKVFTPAAQAAHFRAIGYLIAAALFMLVAK